jgi:putative two-component system response regulator
MPETQPGPRILIVDDLQSNINLLALTLRRAGYEEVLSTTDPQATSVLHLANPFDLILLDLQMPEMSGLEVLRALQEIRKTHPVLVLVLSADPRQREEALAEGADGFIAKPFRLPDVVARVELMLSEARS